MKRLILHIGLGKTGTTSLQCALNQLAATLHRRGVALLVDHGQIHGGRLLARSASATGGCRSWTRRLPGSYCGLSGATEAVR